VWTSGQDGMTCRREGAPKLQWLARCQAPRTGPGALSSPLIHLHPHPYTPSPHSHQTHITTIMKGTTVMATAIAAGTASAGVHKMPLKKVPLSQQLVSSIA